MIPATAKALGPTPPDRCAVAIVLAARTIHAVQVEWHRSSSGEAIPEWDNLTGAQREAAVSFALLLARHPEGLPPAQAHETLRNEREFPAMLDAPFSRCPLVYTAGFTAAVAAGNAILRSLASVSDMAEYIRTLDNSTDPFMELQQPCPPSH